jgi:hypothetical protein
LKRCGQSTGRNTDRGTKRARTRKRKRTRTRTRESRYRSSVIFELFVPVNFFSFVYQPRLPLPGADGTTAVAWARPHTAIWRCQKKSSPPFLRVARPAKPGGEVDVGPSDSEFKAICTEPPYSRLSGVSVCPSCHLARSSTCDSCVCLPAGIGFFQRAGKKKSSGYRFAFDPESNKGYVTNPRVDTAHCSLCCAIVWCIKAIAQCQTGFAVRERSEKVLTYVYT